jgi:hypothetical protein
LSFPTSFFPPCLVRPRRLMLRGLHPPASHQPHLRRMQREPECIWRTNQAFQAGPGEMDCFARREQKADWKRQDLASIRSTWSWQRPWQWRRRIYQKWQIGSVRGLQIRSPGHSSGGPAAIQH